MTPPLLDIVIPIHDQPDWVRLCVDAVRSFTKNTYRLILVDNASSQENREKLAALNEASGPPAEADCLVLWLAENKSFSNAVNAGVAAGDADTVVILNDDAIVTEGWDSHLIQDVADESAGMSGATSNYASGLQGMGAPHPDAPFLVFVCVAIRRKLWNEIGPLDEVTFDGFSSEDLDYSWRVRWCLAGVNRDTGERTLVKQDKPVRRLAVSRAFVLHAGSRTLSAQLGTIEALNANNTKYMARLEQKWGKEFVVANTRPTPRILVVSFSAEEWTRVNFLLCLTALKTGTGFNFAYRHVTRLPIHLARQVACQQALDEGFDAILMLDDDMIFPPDTLQRLFAHRVPVVNALAYGRKPPYAACIFKQARDGFHYDNLEGWEGRGLLEVDGSGLSCVLVQTDVLRKLDAFYYDKLSQEERLDPAKVTEARDKGRKWFGAFEKLGEDLYFCRRVRDAGLPVHCDTSLVIGHTGDAVIVNHRVKQEYLAKQARAAEAMA